MPYISNTNLQVEEMLDLIGISEQDLFADIPPHLRCDKLDLPSGLTEMAATGKLRELANSIQIPSACFAGGGWYDHFIPAGVDAIISRSEFYTAYTPYQPEISQGTLQAIFEYQSMICRLTGMEVSNASLYDGGTAIFEAALMASRITRRNKIIVDASISPIYLKMLQTYTASIDLEIIIIPSDDICSREALANAIDDTIAAVISANPNFLGLLDDLSDITALAHASGALMIISTYPVALGIIKTPGEMDADIVVGEGQSLGLGLNFGGPGLGFMATRKKYMRKMPGRIVGRTTDSRGGSGFVLTLQAREQHIRREKATSNICTNQGLCALMSLIYLTLLGKRGLVELANSCASRARQLADTLTAIDGVSLRYPNQDFFNEFVLSLPIGAGEVCEKLLKKDILSGIPLGGYYDDMPNCLLVAVTEKCSTEQIITFAKQLGEIL